MPTHLFVYGTLLTGIPASMGKFLRRRAQLVGKAKVSGKLYDLGMYPGFVAGEDGTVTGELYRLDEEQVTETMDMLDAYESVTGAPEDEYKKEEVQVRIGDGGVFKATTYVYTKDVAGKTIIPQGNYAPFYAGNAAHERFVNGE